MDKKDSEGSFSFCKRIFEKHPSHKKTPYILMLLANLALVV